MYYIFVLLIWIGLEANPTTLIDEDSGFYKSNSKTMIPMYENITCKDEEVINYIPLNAICIIALERHKNAKALIEYKGQRGWVDVSKNPDDILMMSYEEMQAPTLSMCTQVGAYLFEVKSIKEGRDVKVYEKPSTSSKVLTTLRDHESCLINLGCEWPWCRVDLGENTGWILSINLTDRIESVDGYCNAREISQLLP